MIKHRMVGLVLVAAATGSQAITVLSEGFDNVSNLPAAGWAQVNNSTAPLGHHLGHSRAGHLSVDGFGCGGPEAPPPFSRSKGTIK